MNVFGFVAALLFLAHGCFSLASTPSSVIRTVTTGAQLVTALGDAVTTDVILKNDILLSASDFLMELNIMSIDRNVTIEGYNNSAGALSHAVLDFNYVKRRLRLGPGVTLTLRNLALVRFRTGSLSASPGLDVLVPTLLQHDYAPPARVFVENCLVVLRWCYPPILQAQNIKLFTRPSSLPGVQNVTLRIPQTGCTNDTAAPLWQRCWPSAGLYSDFGLTGADIDQRYVPFPNNYTLWLVNTMYACSGILAESCVLELGPVGCLYKVLAEEREAPAPPAGPAGRSRGAVLVPALAGGLGGAVTLALAATAVMMALSWRRRQRGAASEPSRGSLSETELGGGRLTRGTGAADPNPDVDLGLLRKEQPDPQTPELLDEATDEDTASRAAMSGLKYESGVCTLDLHVVVTPLTPPRPDLALGVTCGSEVTLLPTLIGKGSFGRVQEGMYGGQRVAVKLLPVDTVSEPPPVAAAAGDRKGDPCEDGGDDAAAAGGGDGGGGGGGGGGSSPGSRSERWAEVGDEVLKQQHQQQQQGEQRQGGKALDCAAGARALRTFAQEVEVLGRCCHPNVVRLLAACLGPPQPCLVMELMESSLDKLLHGSGGGGSGAASGVGRQAPLLPTSMVLRIAIDVVRGLEYLHPTIVHRDLKPANVLVNISGPVPVAKISDFGLSRLRNTVLPTRHPEAGTPAYMAPECFDTENLKITHQADIYSFAVIVWEMLTGLVPWWGCTPLAVAYSVTLLGERLPLAPIPPQRCPPELGRLLGQCFEAEPRRRPAAAELVKMLEMIAEAVAAADDVPGVTFTAAEASLPQPPPAPPPSVQGDTSPAALVSATSAAFSSPADEGADRELLRPVPNPPTAGRLLAGSSPEVAAQAP